MFSLQLFNKRFSGGRALFTVRGSLYGVSWWKYGFHALNICCFS